MPTREHTIANAVRLFENLEYKSGFSSKTAWLGIYRTLMWYEPVYWLEFNKLPHIIDADKLRPSSPAKKRTWTKPNIWQKRGQAVSLYLADQLGCTVEDLPQNTDLLMKQPDYEGLQRQNILGIAFVGLVKHVLEKLGSKQVNCETEVVASKIFPGITFPGRSSTPRIDLLAKRNGIPRAIVSAKWSIRHDRLNDITNECPVYKAAYERIYRGSSQNQLRYYLITNEYDPARLTKALNDTCIDGVVHVHKTAVLRVCQLDGRLVRLMDLEELICDTSSW